MIIRIRLSLLPLGLLALLVPACTMSVAPILAADPQEPCPGGSPEWSLQVVDQRADKKLVPDVETPIRSSVVKSLPGCRWVPSGSPAQSITIEVHRFSVVFDGDFESHAEWSVIVRDRDGRTLTEFQVDSQKNRPNYQSSDNEKVVMQQALDEAMHRTLAGIRAVSEPR